MRARDASLREAVWGVPRAHARHWWEMGGGAAPQSPVLSGRDRLGDRGLEPALGQSHARSLRVRAARELPAPDDPAAPCGSSDQSVRDPVSLERLRTPSTRPCLLDGVPRRYWFEGRWGLFKKPLKDEEISFGDWLREKRQIHAGHRNERLWSVTSELYTKTLAGAVQCINQIVAARLPRARFTACIRGARPLHCLICAQVLWWTRIYSSHSSTSKPRRSGSREPSLSSRSG